MEARPYESAWAYYKDCWELLDLSIAFAMKRMEPGAEAMDPALEPFKGLVLTPEEMYRLLEPKQSLEGDPELMQLRKLIGAAKLRLERRIRAMRQSSVFIPLVYLTNVFGLDAFEEQVLMMALALEAHRKYERLYAYLQDDANCKYLTPELAIRLGNVTEPDPAEFVGYFLQGSRLRTWFLQQGTVTPGSVLTQPLRLDERITAFLLGEGYEDKELRSIAKLHQSSAPLPPLVVGQELQQQLRDFAGGPSVFCLWGSIGAGKKLQARHLSAYLGRPLLMVDAEALLREARPFEELLMRLKREAKIHQAMVAVDRFHLFHAEGEGLSVRRQLMLQMVKELEGPSFLLSDQPWHPQPLQEGAVFLEVELPFPGPAERRQLWEALSRGRGLEAAADWSALAGKFRLHPGQMAGALDYAAQLVRWEQGKEAAFPDEGIIHKACYAHMQHNLKRKATKVEAKYSWDRIVLPPEQKEQLVHACGRLKYRELVYGEWGFDRALAYGKGTSLLFAGPPGTGKTMSAQVIASELKLELYRIDLSQVISKYIGETEKNLHEIFQEAGQSGAILFFDEADALFGKRSEVKDAHDKYANVETAYLLQKMEEYEGITVLATNLLNNLDEAFMRRFGFIVKFPFPDAEHREKLWRGMLPPEVPLDPDVDFRFLASRFEMAGGLIKNVVVSAAFLAAEAGASVGMKQLLTAVRTEMRKNGKLLLPSDLGEYAELITG